MTTMPVDAVRSRLRELLDDQRLVPAERACAIARVTGSERVSSIVDPVIGQRVIASLEAAIERATTEIPL